MEIGCACHAQYQSKLGIHTKSDIIKDCLQKVSLRVLIMGHARLYKLLSILGLNMMKLSSFIQLK